MARIIKYGILFTVFALVVHGDPEPRRRISGGSRTFESRPGMGHARHLGEEVIFEEHKDDETGEGDADAAIQKSTDSAADDDSTPKHETTNVNDDTSDPVESPSESEKSKLEDQLAVNILKGKAANASDEPIKIENAATVPTHVEKDEIFWIDTTFKATDAGMNISTTQECKSWQKYWDMAASNLTDDNFQFITNVNESFPLEQDSSEEKSGEANMIPLVEYELIETKKRLKELKLSTDLFEKFEVVGVLFKELCGNHDRQLIFKTPEDARRIGINENSTICDPFKEELQPNTDTLMQLSLQLNELVQKSHLGNMSYSPHKKLASETEAEDVKIFLVASDNRVTPAPKTDEQSAGSAEEKALKEESLKTQRKLIKRKIDEAEKKGEKKSSKKSERSRTTTTTTTTTTDPPSAEENQDEADWLELLAISNQVLENLSQNESFLENAWLQIDAIDETNPVMYILYPETADILDLAIPHHSFKRYEKVGLFLPGICADYVPTAIDAFNASDFEGIEIEGPIGVNITALELAGVNLTELAEKLRNDTEVDEILTRTNESSRALGGSYILPVLNKNQYDPFSAPIVFQGSAVVVRFGIYIESMSNFQTSTMDYDMDIYLLLAWRDARLVNPYDKPILVKEEEILEKIWRPDPFFDAKEAEFHEVTFLNFLMRIYNDGLVLYETRIKLKPACNLILCKYPHDKQTCELQIKSFAYPIETVRFEWFTRKVDAIDKNPDVKLPELYIDRYEPTFCNRSRKSGHFSCLRAVFRLKRDVGFHIAQTYIPTSLALMFSWVGVWLPEEFMEGRIGVAITVLLTLSTESAGAREHLPSVSYLKAIDLWFGYITGFVFFTLLQTLFIIGFDKRANQLRKWANRRRLDLTQEARESMIMKANRYHKTGRYLDNFCRVFYPLSFLLFLIMYYFVFTEGRQDDCISTR